MIDQNTGRKIPRHLTRGLDFSNPKIARTYLESLRDSQGRAIGWFDLEDGTRVMLRDLSDSQCVQYAAEMRNKLTASAILI